MRDVESRARTLVGWCLSHTELVLGLVDDVMGPILLGANEDVWGRPVTGVCAARLEPVVVGGAGGEAFVNPRRRPTAAVVSVDPNALALQMVHSEVLDALLFDRALVPIFIVCPADCRQCTFCFALLVISLGGGGRQAAGGAQRRGIARHLM